MILSPEGFISLQFNIFGDEHALRGRTADSPLRCFGVQW